MITKQIVISENEILNKYSNLNEKVKFIIKRLYVKNSIDYELNNFDINIKTILVDKELLEKNNSFLKDYRDKTGVYIFLNNNNIPVYIGFSGKGKKQDLKKRIDNQLSAKDNNYSNIVTNIIKIEKELDYINLKNHFNNIEDIIVTLKLREDYYKKRTEIRPEIDFKELQRILLKYTSSLIIVCIGSKENEENVKFAQALEVILIALFNSKYNL